MLNIWNVKPTEGLSHIIPNKALGSTLNYQNMFINVLMRNIYFNYDCKVNFFFKDRINQKVALHVLKYTNFENTQIGT